MGLTAAFKGVDSSGVARFDASSMVAWREKQTLERMKLEEMQRARVCVCFSVLHGGDVSFAYCACALVFIFQSACLWFATWFVRRPTLSWSMLR